MLENPKVEKEIEERYFLVRDEKGRHCIAYKSKDEEQCIISAIFSEMDYIMNADIFLVKDVETESYGFISIHAEELLPCIFQSIVISEKEITLIDFNSNADYIYIAGVKSIKDALLRYTKRLKYKDVFVNGKIAGGRKEISRRDISSEELQFSEERDAD